MHTFNNNYYYYHYYKLAVTIDTSAFKLRNVCLISVKCQAHENTQFLRQQPSPLQK